MCETESSWNVPLKGSQLRELRKFPGDLLLVRVGNVGLYRENEPSEGQRVKHIHVLKVAICNTIGLYNGTLQF